MEGPKNTGYFLLGVGVGAIMGLLFTSRSGTEARKYLERKSPQTTDVLQRQADDLLDQAADTIDRGKRSAEDQVKNVNDAIEEGKQAYHEAVEQR